MNTLVETIAKALVTYPDEVLVETTDDGGETTIRLSCHPDDMGKLIGKQGKIAHAIRSIVKAAAIRNDLRVRVEIVEK